MRRNVTRTLVQGAAVTLLAHAGAHADEGITTSISGFGTIAAVATNHGDYQFVENSTQFKGATKEPDIGLDSRLGLQGTLRFDPRFSVTAQATAERRGSKDFDIGTEWLFAQFTPTPGVDLRLGRVVLPVFLISDSRKVGYATTWLHAPTEVYGAVPYTSLDGLQGTWRSSLGPVTLTSQLSYGKTSAQILAGTLGEIDAQARNVINASLTLETGDFTARIADTRMTVPVSLPVSSTTSIDFDNQDKFLSLALQYDNGTALLMSEWTRRSENDVPGIGLPISATTAWYVAAGWRIDKWTPMLRYTSSHSGQSLNSFASRPSESAILRYDLMRDVDLKFQVDRYDANNTTAFTAPSATTGTTVTVFGFGADFVF